MADFVLTVWQGGTWKIQDRLSAQYCTGDPDFVGNLELPPIMLEYTKIWAENTKPNFAFREDEDDDDD